MKSCIMTAMKYAMLYADIRLLKGYFSSGETLKILLDLG